MSDLEPIQQSRLGEIGQLLSQARQEKGMTLEEVSGKTLIRATILKAIEEGDARPLPEPVYIRGFIRRFGDLVGLNGTELCDSFPWQPSGSVPLSFVTAGTVGGVQAPSQEAEASTAPEIEKPEVQEVSAGVSKMASADTATAAVAEQSGVAVEAEAPSAFAGDDAAATPTMDLPAADVMPGASMAEAPLAAPEQAVAEPAELDASVGSAQSSRPDHDAAYESRAALFGVDEVADQDEAAAVHSPEAVVPAASVKEVPAVSETAANVASADSVVEEPAPDSANVATLPPPPAPVFYREPERRSPLPWILAAVAALLGVGFVALALGDRPTSKTVADEPAAVEQVESSSDEAASTDASGTTEASTPAEAQPAAVASDKVVLELEVKGTEDAWMDVLVDGELQIEGNQVPGFKQRWEGDREIELATARPDMVWISVNGSKPQPFGKLAEANPVKVGGFKPANAQ